MQAYRLGCKKHANNIGSKKVAIDKSEINQYVLIVWLKTKT